MLKRRVALVVPGLTSGGGVPTVAAFLYKVLAESGRYHPELVSLPMSARDSASVRLLAPASWTRGPCITEGLWEEKPFRHVGAFLTEFEFQRYRPRPVLTDLLNEYDLIQVVAGTPAWALVGRNVKKPVVLQVATLARAERSAKLNDSRGVRGLWYRLMTKLTARLDVKSLQYLSVVFIENEWMGSYLQSQLHPARIVFAPPGVDTDLFRPTASKDDGYILSVGRFGDPRKNTKILFETYYHLRRTRPQSPRLMLVGQSLPSQADWKLAVALGISDYIDVKQNVTVQALAEIYRKACLFVLSSDEEGLGMVILEAMASGIPVVSTRCGGPETMIVEGESGYLTPVGDSIAMARRIVELQENRFLRQQMGAAGRRVVEKRFSLAVAGRVYLEKYDEITQACALNAPTQSYNA